MVLLFCPCIFFPDTFLFIYFSVQILFWTGGMWREVIWSGGYLTRRLSGQERIVTGRDLDRRRSEQEGI